MNDIDFLSERHSLKGILNSVLDGLGVIKINRRLRKAKERRAT